MLSVRRRSDWRSHFSLPVLKVLGTGRGDSGSEWGRTRHFGFVRGLYDILNEKRVVLWSVFLRKPRRSREGPSP